MTKQTYFCRDPKLAGQLIARGFKPNFVPPGWGFELTEKLCLSVEAFYRRENPGEPLPRIISEFLQESEVPCNG